MKIFYFCASFAEDGTKLSLRSVKEDLNEVFDIFKLESTMVCGKR